MILYALSVFLSAFLLFQVEPFIAKAMLPWFGGSSMVWSSAMLFFQIILVGGYAYSLLLARRHRGKMQSVPHLILLCVSCVQLLVFWYLWPSPVTPGAALRPSGSQSPVVWIFLLLGISVGLPFFLLSSNSSLMQAWHYRQEPARSPYWLYAVSSGASILGLLAYPFLIEPTFTLAWQGRLWAGGYLLFAALAGGIAIRVIRRDTAPAELVPEVTGEVDKSNKGTMALWMLLSAGGSLMMLAVTNQLTQEVAAIPFLWVLPSVIYLLSFVLVFSSRRLYWRKVFVFLLTLASAAWFSINLIPIVSFTLEIIIYALLLFAATMVCHGELAALRPPASRLTLFYLAIAIGGALGGVFVNLLAPLLFKGFWELHLGVALVWILLAICSHEGLNLRSEHRTSVWINLLAVLTSLNLVLLVYYSLSGNRLISRNFYGVVQVRERPIGPDREEACLLVHGSTIHGYQFMDPEWHDLPTAYYTHDSGVGLAILGNPQYGKGMRVGVLGLGAGVLVSYGQPGDIYRFYEINPVIIDLAQGQDGYFSFLSDSLANIEIVPGDARLSLEAESDNHFDMLVLDTFSSDAIPAHLVTMEAIAIYLRHLAPNGLIAAHITNGRLDLRPLFWRLGQEYGLEFAVVENPAEWQNPAALPSTWVLLTRDPTLFDEPGLAEVIDQGVDFRMDIRMWTDDYSNLLQLVK